MEGQKQKIYSRNIHLVHSLPRALPRPAVASPRLHFFGTIVAREDDNGVVSDAEFLEVVKECAEIAVKFQQRIRPVPVACLALNVGTRDGWQVPLTQVEPKANLLFSILANHTPIRFSQL